MPIFEKQLNCEYFLNLRVIRRYATWFDPADTCLGVFQFPLGRGAREYSALPATAPVEITETEQQIIITGGNLEVIFCKECGLIRSASKNGACYLGKRSGAEVLSRPRDGISCRTGWGRSPVWQHAEALQHSLISITACQAGSRALVETVRKAISDLGNVSFLRTRYLISADGRIEVDAVLDVDTGASDVSRAGLEFLIPAGFEALSYYGRGENENYCDRILSAPMGLYHSTVEAQHFAFIPPSECGGHEDTRWLTLSDDAGHTLRVQTAGSFHFDVHHSSIEEYKTAAYDHLLPRHTESWLHIDAAHAGIGCDMAWSTVLTEENRVNCGVYSLQFTIELL